MFRLLTTALLVLGLFAYLPGKASAQVGGGGGGTGGANQPPATITIMGCGSDTGVLHCCGSLGVEDPVWQIIEVKMMVDYCPAAGGYYSMTMSLSSPDEYTDTGWLKRVEFSTPTMCQAWSYMKVRNTTTLEYVIVYSDSTTGWLWVTPN